MASLTSFTWPTLLVLFSSSTSLAAPLPLSNFINSITKRDHTDDPEEIEDLEEFHDHQHSHMPPHILALIIVLTIVGTLILAALGMCLFHWLKARRVAATAGSDASTTPETSTNPSTSTTPVSDVKSPPESEAGLRGGALPEADEPDCSWCYISEKKLCGWCSGENQDPPEAAHRRMSSIDGSSMFSGHTRVGSEIEVKHSFRPDLGLYTLPSSPRITPIASPSITPITSPALSSVASYKGKERVDR
ncbi:hypothetical protein EDC01DRAFT_631261 [Geopyxis carbonaria]|nr:hypothetical protein EDC01DRAFT_631261 [Geopyxis carbonaria]